MQSSHTFAVGSAVFDEPNLVSAAGLVPVMELAEQTGLSRLIGEHVDLPSTRVVSGAVNAAGKLTTIIAGMMCGADSIDDVNVLRAGGTPRVFDEVYAPSTLGILLREFTFGNAKVCPWSDPVLVTTSTRIGHSPVAASASMTMLRMLLRTSRSPVLEGRSKDM